MSKNMPHVSSETERDDTRKGAGARRSLASTLRVVSSHLRFQTKGHVASHVCMSDQASSSALLDQWTPLLMCRLGL